MKPGSSETYRARLLGTVRQLLARSAGTLEAIGAGQAIDEAALSAAAEKHILDSPKIESSGQWSGDSTEISSAEVLANLKGVLRKTSEKTDVDAFSDVEFASLEAIVQLTGRPAMRYKDGQVEMPNDLGENSIWRVLVATARRKINTVSGSVGRVETNDLGVDGRLLGTAWRLGANLVVTNRHVASHLVIDRTKAVADWKLDIMKTPFVNFGVSTPSGVPRKCRIAEIGYCAPPNDIDFAILKLVDGSPEEPPPPLSIDFSAETLGTDLADGGESKAIFRGEHVYVVGHPYGRIGSDAVSRVFGNADGSKRWSPGFVKTVDEREPILEHDCSTLGGNSGSCVFAAGRHCVVGLHFGGLCVDALSGVGRSNVAIAFSRLNNHPANEILRTGRV